MQFTYGVPVSHCLTNCVVNNLSLCRRFSVSLTHSKPLLYFLVPASCSLVCMGAKASENLSSHCVCVCVCVCVYVLVIVVIPSVCTLNVCTRRGFLAIVSFPFYNTKIIFL